MLSRSIVTLSLFYLQLLDIFVRAAPLCPETITMAGGGLPNATLPKTITQSGIKEIQLAQFLENLEVEFFTEGFNNISAWGTESFSNSTAEIICRIASVSVHATEQHILTHAKRERRENQRRRQLRQLHSGANS
jgi:hypothetical protein